MASQIKNISGKIQKIMKPVEAQIEQRNIVESLEKLRAKQRVRQHLQEFVIVWFF